MDEGARESAVFVPRSEFDPFLFATVCEEPNGMTLSVLSMLARAGGDPWGAAAELAAMPGGAAVERITSLIHALPAGTDQDRDAGKIASRLLSLLPRRASAAIAARHLALREAQGTPRAVATGFMILAFLIAAGWLLANR